jgi:hypothetical protein
LRNNVPVSPGGEEVKLNGLGGFRLKGEFVLLSMHRLVVPPPHHPCSVACAGGLINANAAAPPNANADSNFRM